MAPLDPVHQQHLTQMREDLEAFLSANQVEIDSVERDALQTLNVEQLSRLIRELVRTSTLDIAGRFHDSMIAFAGHPIAVLGDDGGQDSECTQRQPDSPGDQDG